MTTEDRNGEADLAALLRAAGRRPEPSESMAAEVQAAVEVQWREMVAERARRRRMATWSAAAALVVAVVGVWLASPLWEPAGGPVASVARIEGPVEYRGDGERPWSPLPAGVALKPGDELRTGPAGRVALRLASGVELRLDTGTRLAIDDVHRAWLRRGGLYVDSGVAGPDDARGLEIATRAGDVRHLGTQYEVRVSRDALRISVREGLVAISGRAGEALARAGEQVTVEQGQVKRAALASDSGAWAWIGTVTPPFAIEGRSVDEFLAWAGRQTGRQVVYGSAAAARQAQDIVLRGSVQGLAPDAAVHAVLATTPLRAVIDDGRIRVDAAAF